MNNDVRASIAETNILLTCSEIEDTVAIIYRYFSNLYSDTKEISDLFFKTALEEDEHANQFRLAYRLHGAGMKTIKADSKQIQAIFEKLRLLYSTIQTTPPSIKQALQLSIKVETTLAEYHMSSMVEFQDPSLSKLFVSMKNNDDAHVQMLLQASDTYN